MANGSNTEIWGAVNSLRDTVASLTAAIGRVEEVVRGLDRLLADRCAFHAAKIDRVTTQVEDLEVRHEHLKSRVDAHLGWMAGAGAFGAIVGTVATTLFVKLWS